MSTSEPDKAGEPSAAGACQWMTPGAHGTPAEAVARIRAICAAIPDLYGALFVVVGTHQGLPREILAVAVQQCRADAAAHKREDLAALMTAIWTGGREGYDAVLRARRKGERKGNALGWVKD